MPLTLRGEIPVATWAPPTLPDASADFLAKVVALYREDRTLGPDRALTRTGREEIGR